MSIRSCLMIDCEECLNILKHFSDGDIENFADQAFDMMENYVSLKEAYSDPLGHFHTVDMLSNFATSLLHFCKQHRAMLNKIADMDIGYLELDEVSKIISGINENPKA